MDDKPNISKYVPYSDAIRRLENNHAFKSLEDALVKTLDYLDTRYLVKMDYDLITHPVVDRKDELLFKIYDKTKEIMWVYLIYAPRVRYLSIEVDNNRVKNIRPLLTCFDRIIERTGRSSPSLKLTYQYFDQIATALEAICDCLEGNNGVNAIDINTPIKPKGIVRKKDGVIQYICGRCNTTFVKSSRCPECGQLVKE